MSLVARESLAGLTAFVASLALTTIAAAEPATQTIAPGVKIDGLAVEGMTAAEAKAAVLKQRVAPRRQRFVARFNRLRFPVYPVRLGYTADVDYAVQAALLFGARRAVPEGGVNVRLRQRVNKKKLRAFLTGKARRGVIAPRDASLTITTKGFRRTKARFGKALNITKAGAKIQRLILARKGPRAVAMLPTKRLKPAVTSAGTGVLVNRNTFKLQFFKAGRVRTFPIAVGQIGFSTPSGRWSIVTKQRNPWWYPPASPWAAGSNPVPPGPGNPLGTRWMGLNATFIGIHGTPSSGSLGSRASHGCIRMNITDAEWMFDQVDVGTPVLVV
ncbi:MAG: L,D-transpeptidase/peptidoglycan binding protein [Thermoleophilia bacterium]|nr:L,D-transpeptidase/peptidoglycan binding protein [Thermoleophilia bacterium]MDH3725147.1 L,D-transpeptidase/peptidoglycan binding protein [Thermoleophilia bacterium]